MPEAVASIRTEILVEAPAAQVWDAVRDVGAVHRRLLPGYVAETRVDGHVRTLVVPNGGLVRELIVAVDDASRRMAYTVVESRQPITHHHASFQVFPEGLDRSRLVWITDLLPDSLAEEVRARMERGAEVMKRTLEAEAAPG
jgi:carbon monoxide dehydrogenase subunit G